MRFYRHEHEWKPARSQTDAVIGYACCCGEAESVEYRKERARRAAPVAWRCACGAQQRVLPGDRRTYCCRPCRQRIARSTAGGRETRVCTMCDEGTCAP